MAYKDLTKQKGAYRIVAINPDPRLEGRIYVGYKAELVCDAEAWKFATRAAAEKCLKESEFSNVTVKMVV